MQFIATLARHANLLVLNLRRDLELAVANDAGDFLGHCGFNPLLDFDRLARVAEWRDVGVRALDVLHAHTALGEFADDHFLQGLDFESIGCGKLDLAFLQRDFRVASLEVEALREFLFRLVDGVLDFHRVHFRNNVE